ncbi:MAG: zinc-binding dehydrogenase [Phenylobacterium sp.]|uniref:zinc-binding dehydrogenase n=1 Tax=Phenylobacterium sp. TaxID=1871053 RepID=UPI0027369A91|nr:zinc-binding dehydrogenase [Phenylobacterium sp.]MDP3749928.1 zinc-binding dehydrogenase [Phenylobacterium sp.]
MAAVQALENGRLEFVERPIPAPARGEVLIRVHCSPVNPADRMQIAGAYVRRRDPPFTPGLVGVGTVVEARRAGLAGRLVAGRRVVFAPGPDREGVWAQFAIAPVSYCLPLANDLSDTDGVNLLANATTIFGLLDRANSAKAKAVVLTGAGGEIGKLLNRAARQRGVTMINVVRREEQAEALRRNGCEHIVVSDIDDFQVRLGTLARGLGATLAFDAIAGEMTRRLLAALPDGSEVVVFGRLSGDDVGFDGFETLVGRRQKLSGFDVNVWLGSLSTLAVLRVAKKAAALLRKGEGTQVQHRVGLADLVARYDELQRDQTSGKTILFPNGDPWPDRMLSSVRQKA